jgi:hypothetical protein
MPVGRAERRGKVKPLDLGAISGDARREQVGSVKALAAVFAAVLLAGVVLAYLLRGTDGIAVVLALLVFLGILYGWRTH